MQVGTIDNSLQVYQVVNSRSLLTSGLYDYHFTYEGVMHMLTIGLLTALGLAVGASFGKALGVAVGAYLVACIVTGVMRKC
ncbi:hypothetical protein RU52_00004 [Citrobacter phage phiCFP-1]|uniref:Uncharacterized protein n=1 Tax=Citrobacter phage phiCFP-1 TaxID=1610508 RepID=A0A0E3JJI0_9CAUD|nr:hypothetical protein RU52_00004 [Citrobacter phage phiCFP-1]AKA62122.1 hypothetical protein RU52_00004 [Citrobacter phage phiCFP-1]